LNDKALSFEAAADPVLVGEDLSRRPNLVAAANSLTEAIAILESLLKDDQVNENWKSILADAQVRLGTIQSTLYPQRQTGALSKKGIAALKELATRDQVSTMTLDEAANAFMQVQPSSLRDFGFALTCADREVALSHERRPIYLLTLARAYRATGQLQKSRTVANQGLAQLPPFQSGSMKPNIRRLLESLAQTGK